MQVRNNFPSTKGIGRSTVVCVALFLLVGCSSTARRTATTVAPTTDDTSPPPVAANAEPGGTEPGSTIPGLLLPEEVRADYEAAVNLLEEARYEPGIALLHQVIDRAPTLASAHVDLGIAHARTGDVAAAEQSLLAALDLNPGHPVAHNELGLIQRHQGKFAEARASYEAALEGHADFHHAHRNLGILCDLYLGDYACALEHYETYSVLVPSDEVVVRWIADVRQRSGAPPGP